MLENNILPLKTKFAGAITQVSLRPKLRKVISQQPKQQYNPFMLLGSGAFGSVYSAYCNGGRVAIKKVLIDPRFINRELDILAQLNSPFCLKLIDSYTSNSVKSNETYLCIVTDLMPSSLKQHISKLRSMQRKLSPLLLKLFTYELFAGLDHVHSLGITHRDIKTDNVLVDESNGLLKICDFGTAKMIIKDEESASYIASRHFRAPEILLQSTHYGQAIDIWAAACVIAEMLRCDSQPMFLGDSNADQLVQIMKVLGKPSQTDIDSFQHNLPFPEVEQISNLKNVLPIGTDEKLFDLLKRIFVYNPEMRPTAKECMKSPYFEELFKEGIKLPNGNKLPELPRPL